MVGTQRGAYCSLGYGRQAQRGAYCPPGYGRQAQRGAYSSPGYVRDVHNEAHTALLGMGEASMVHIQPSWVWERNTTLRIPQCLKTDEKEVHLAQMCFPKGYYRGVTRSLSDRWLFSPGEREQLCAECPTNDHTFRTLRYERLTHPHVSAVLSPMPLHFSPRSRRDGDTEPDSVCSMLVYPRSVGSGDVQKAVIPPY